MAWPKNQQQHLCIRQQYRCMGHTVRIIVIDDIPGGRGYKNDILEVKAGFARNYLIPQKMAVYATRQNFRKYELDDPILIEKDPNFIREKAKNTLEVDLDLKASDLLRYYLRNKIVSLYF